MPDSLSYAQVCGRIDAALALIRREHHRLSQLDGAVGDGDHGTTILRAMEAAAQAAAGPPAADLKALFAAVGWAVLGCDGGSTGPLLGSFFLGFGDPLAGRCDLDFASLRAAFESGVARLQKQSRAQIGDKTMMDAFLPALAALRAADPAQGLAAALQRAAQAAAEGAEATRTMRARFGRARNLGDRVLGHLDPGAVSVSLILKGLCPDP